MKHYDTENAADHRTNPFKQSRTNTNQLGRLKRFSNQKKE